MATRWRHALDEHDEVPELVLVVAVLHQALKDMHSPRPDIRTEARDFFHDRAAVAFWADLVNVELDALRGLLDRR